MLLAFPLSIIFFLGTQRGLGPLLAAGAWEKEAQKAERVQLPSPGPHPLPFLRP